MGQGLLGGNLVINRLLLLGAHARIVHCVLGLSQFAVDVNQGGLGIAQSLCCRLSLFLGCSKRILLLLSALGRRWHGLLSAGRCGGLRLGCRQRSLGLVQRGLGLPHGVRVLRPRGQGRFGDGVLDGGGGGLRLLEGAGGLLLLHHGGLHVVDNALPLLGLIHLRDIDATGRGCFLGGIQLVRHLLQLGQRPPHGLAIGGAGRQAGVLPHLLHVGLHQLHRFARLFQVHVLGVVLEEPHEKLL
mmetsp:Transcript_7863/g.15103  ORF Transcript_7863/g.15103 Transcript_7863/m.15103 type:complete len:243 (+) Transcript_7863:546-1274(+)